MLQTFITKTKWLEENFLKKKDTKNLLAKTKSI